MSSSTGLSFATPHGLALVAAAAVLLAATLASYLGLRDQIRPGLRRLLGALRAAALVLVFACLAEPMLKTAVPHEERRSVAVALDSSLSMSIPDGSSGGEPRATRLDSAKSIAAAPGGIIDRLKRDFNVLQFAFDDGARQVDSVQDIKASGEKTDIGRSLDEISATLDRSAAGIIVLTDGADNSGRNLDAAAAALGRRGVPVYAVGLGSEEVVDVAVTGVSARRKVTSETTVSVDVEVTTAGYPGADVPVTITSGGATVARGRARIEAGRGRTSLEFVPARDGLQEYSVAVPVFEKEIVTENNARSFAMDVVKRRLKVLYMEGSQYKRDGAKYGFWEHQYIQQALVEDGMDVTALLRDKVEAAREAGVWWVRHPEHGYPRTRKDLFAYDVIISSDIDREFFTDEQLRNTVEFVARHGGGFCMIGGWTAFGPGGYDKSVIDKMLPVDMLGRWEGYEDDVGGEGFKWEITDEGRVHPIMHLVPDPEKNLRIWEAMPSFFGYNWVQRAKPAATVLAKHPDDTNLYGQRVMLAVQPYGRGRSMAFTTDSTAGWGLRFEEEFGEDGDNRYFKTFWKNAVRWLAQYRLNAPAKLVMIETDRNLYERGDRAQVAVTVLNSDYEPTHDAEAQLSVEMPDGKPQSVELSPDFERPGRWKAELPLASTGKCKLSARAYDGTGVLGEDAETLTVVHPTREFADLRRNAGVLQDLARRTNGRCFTPDEAPKICDELRESTRVVTQYRIDSIWDSWAVLALLVVALSAEWFLRKRAGLP